MPRGLRAEEVLQLRMQQGLPARQAERVNTNLSKPLCIDGYCGLGGWAEGFLAEGYDVIGFDIERRPYPGQLVLQDMLTVHGSQFKDATILVMSPPCQKYSYLAMPWSRSTSEHSQAAKALRRKWETEGPDNRLFDACFRIQREAIEALQRKWFCRHPKAETCDQCFIPLIVENVRGAQPWVGRAAWSYGSFFLWGDVPALMPFTSGMKVPGFRFDGNGGSCQTASVNHTKNNGGSWFAVANNTASGHSRNPVTGEDGTKIGGDWFSDPKSTCRKHGSRSAARKAASAQIAKIPFELARWVAYVYKPRNSLAQVRRPADAGGETISLIT